jgi:hypothetical protein
LEALLQRHLSYISPLGFSVPLDPNSIFQELLASVAHTVPPVSPTLLLVQGTYDTEYFRWVNVREIYKIILDEISAD